jgi:hypothetical protein
MNGMKHVPPSVISSARIRDLLEIDNVAQGESGSPSEGQFVAIVHRPSSPSSSAKAKAASGAKSGRPFGARRSITPGGFKSRRCCGDGHGIRTVARMTGSGNGTVARIKQGTEAAG